jgi:CDP-diacylglycerol pyrophosphatase
MRRTKLALIVAAAAVVPTLGIGAQYQEAQAGESVSTVYLWKDVNGKCPATCDRNQYDCPCKTAAELESAE